MARSKSWVEFQAEIKANSNEMREAEKNTGMRTAGGNTGGGKLTRFSRFNDRHYISQVQTAQMRAELFDKIMADNADSAPLIDSTMEDIPDPTPQNIVRDVEELVGRVRVVSKKNTMMYDFAKAQNLKYGRILMRSLCGQFVLREMDDRSKDILGMDLPRPAPDDEIETADTDK
jgi:hypothetical protein